MKTPKTRCDKLRFNLHACGLVYEKEKYFWKPVARYGVVKVKSRRNVPEHAESLQNSILDSYLLFWYFRLTASGENKKSGAAIL